MVTGVVRSGRGLPTSGKSIMHTASCFKSKSSKQQTLHIPEDTIRTGIWLGTEKDYIPSLTDGWTYVDYKGFWR
jgi:hypothetical protein